MVTPGFPEFLKAVYIGDPSAGQDLLTTLHYGAEDRPIRFISSIPMFNKFQAAETIRANSPQVIIVHSEVQGYNVHDIINLRNDAQSPFVLAGLTQMGSTKGEEMKMLGFDLVFHLPLTSNEIDLICKEVPPKYQEAAEGWKKGAYKSIVPQELQTTLASAPGSVWQRQKILFYSPKGGTGKTTCSRETAVILAALGGKSVALVDVNMNGGHIAPSLGVKSNFGILNAATLYYDRKGTSMEHETADKIIGFMPEVKGTNGRCKVLPGIDNINKSSMDNIANEKGMAFVEWLLNNLILRFDFVIVDMGSSLTAGAHLGALKSADQICVVVTPDYFSMGDAKSSIHTFISPRIGIALDRFKMVYNRYNPEIAVPLAEAAEKVAITGLAEIPDDSSYSLTVCSNSGRSFFGEFSPRENNSPEIDKVLDGFVSLAGHFYPPILEAWTAKRQKNAPGNKKSGGFFGFGKK